MILLVFLAPLRASVDYSECITDIYFGNGVWNTYTQAKDGENELRKRLILKGIIQENEIMNEGESAVGKRYAFKVAYNWHGMYRTDPTHDEKFKQFFDLAETYVQMKEAGQVDNSSLFRFLEWFLIDAGYPEEFRQKLKAYVSLATVTHLSNVMEMVADYQQYSFDKGHRVLLVSHSQGNLWANDMVKAFKPWQREYFRNVGVAVPSDHMEAIGRYVTLTCDKVMMAIPGHLPPNQECYGVEELSGHEFIRSYMRNDNSEHEIFRDSEFYLKILGALDSQWQTDQEIDKGTCDYRITVKHRFDPALEIGEKVYPFAPNQKLYQVNGEYVKATCGGTDFTDDWAEKKENECWMINNSSKEKIVKKAECAFEVAVNNGEYTCYNENIFFTYVHTTNYGDYTFHVHYDDVNTSWTACRHCTQGWTNSYGDRLEIGNGAGGSWIHQAINFYVHIAE